MATDFGALKTQVLNWMNRSDLSSVVGDFINIANDRASRLLRVPTNEAFVTIALDVNDRAPVPADYVEGKTMTFYAGGRARTLDRKDYREVIERGSTENGLPEWFAREFSNFVFAPNPSGVTEVDLYYWACFPELVDDTDTNWLVTDAPEILLYGALSEGSLYLKKEEDAAIWQAKFNAAIEEVQVALADESEWSGGYLVSQIYQG